MTLAELFAKLGITSTPELEQAVAEYTAAQTTALKKNRDDLLKDNKKLKDAIKAFDGIDSAELVEALEAANIDASELIDHLKKPPSPSNEKVEKQIADGIAAAQKAMDRKLKKSEDDLKAAQEALNKSNKARIDEHNERVLVTEIAAQKGNVDLLLPMLRGRVKSEIDEDGKINTVFLAANGDELQGAGGQVATVSTLIGSIKADEKFGIAFEAEGGGSAAKGSTKRPTGSTGVNPWVKGPNFNRTAQAKMRQENPTLAATLERQAQTANAAA